MSELVRATGRRRCTDNGPPPLILLSVELLQPGQQEGRVDVRPIPDQLLVPPLLDILRELLEQRAELRELPADGDRPVRRHPPAGQGREALGELGDRRVE